MSKTVTALVCVMGLAGIWGADLKSSIHHNRAVSAIAQCEAYLPRDQQCEAVITARVKEKN